MKPPAGTTWRHWTAVCPYCCEGIFVSTGLEFERAIASHECAPPRPFPEPQDLDVA